jgi:hypothetical protein
MAPRLVSPVDEQYIGVGLGDQRVREGEAAGTRADDEVVGGQFHVEISSAKDVVGELIIRLERCSG